jgi:integrase
MTTLRERLDRYLVMRRALGFQLNEIERQVGLFCTWLEARGQTQTFTIDDAVTWARLNPDAHPSWWATRLSLVRRFAAYLNANGVDVPVIPRGLLPAKKPRAVPYIYSQNDVEALLAACAAKFTDERLVPVHPSTTATLADYIALPARTVTRPDPNGPVFVTAGGTGYAYVSFFPLFKRARQAAGLTPRGRVRPRLHDLRHTLATAHMTAAYAHHKDPDRVLSLLATWLGHSDAAHTYWYLTATGELMALAANMLESDSEGELP